MLVQQVCIRNNPCKNIVLVLMVHFKYEGEYVYNNKTVHIKTVQ